MKRHKAHLTPKHGTNRGPFDAVLMTKEIKRSTRTIKLRACAWKSAHAWHHLGSQLESIINQFSRTSELKVCSSKEQAAGHTFGWHCVGLEVPPVPGRVLVMVRYLQYPSRETKRFRIQHHAVHARTGQIGNRHTGRQLISNADHIPLNGIVSGLGIAGDAKSRHPNKKPQ